MQINHSNIEERLFDYFEGNLNEREKVELMSFIHQNPEYERDFAAWAQSFAMQAEPVKEYRLEKILLKKGRPILFNKMLYIASAVIVIIGGYYLYKLLQDKASQSISQQEIKKDVKTNRPVEKSTSKNLPVTKTTTGKKNNSIQRLNTQKVTKPENNNIAKDSLVQVTSASQSEPANKTSVKDSSAFVPLEEIKEKVETKKENTEINQEQEIDKEPQKPEKKKNKRALDLKPSSDFLPVNKNF